MIGYVFKHVFKELTSENVGWSFSTAKDRPRIVNSTNFPEIDRLHGVSTLYNARTEYPVASSR